MSDRTRKTARANNRLMLFMSVFDIFQSAAMAVSSAAIPRETGTYGAKGNDSTCTAQGFVIMLGLAVPLYNSSLNLFYLLTIQYKMSHDRFASAVEPILHIVSILFPLSLAIIFSIRGDMSPYGTLCLVPTKASRVLTGTIIGTSLLFCLYSSASICCFAYRVRRQYKLSSNNSASNAALETREVLKP